MFTLCATYGIRSRGKRVQRGAFKRVHTERHTFKVESQSPSLEVTVEHKVEHEESKMEAVLQLVARKVEWNL